MMKENSKRAYRWLYLLDLFQHHTISKPLKTRLFYKQFTSAVAELKTRFPRRLVEKQIPSFNSTLISLMVKELPKENIPQHRD